MTTKIFGASDDLIEFRGDVYGEVGASKGLVICSDGTVLSIEYGKGELAVWQVVSLRAGSIFRDIDHCFDEDADPFSDVAHFNEGLEWAYVATEWQKAG